MNVLHILSSDDQYGSAQCFLELLEREVQGRKVSPIVVTPKINRINRRCDELNVKNYAVDYDQFLIPKHNGTVKFALKYIYHSLLYYKKLNKARQELKKIIENHNINIIHTNSCVVDIGSLAAEETGIKNIWHLREFGKEDFNFFSVRRNCIEKMNAPQNMFISVSRAVTQTWINRGLNPNNIITVYDGVDAGRFEVKKSTESAGKKIHIVMCGSFCEAKNQKLLVKAISKMDDNEKSAVSVDFYGRAEGRYFEETERLVNEFNLGSVITFKGFVNDIPHIIMDYDVGVLCSRAEAFGRVTVEYMLASLCMVVPASGANPEIIDNSCGLLYEPGNAEALLESLRKVIRNGTNLKELGRNARQKAIEKYDINKNAENIINVFLDNAGH